MSLKLSVVIPIYNEQGNIRELIRRLNAVMVNNFKEDEYEIILIDDGSKDNTVKILREMPLRNTKLILLAKNFGQHSAILAGFEIAKGESVITLDADLQNPPEEIPKLYNYFEQGYDLVAVKREERIDNPFRKYMSKVMNEFNRRIIKSSQTDFGCMLRLYSKEICKQVLENKSTYIFIPAMATYFAKNIIEIEAKHEKRKTGRSKYNLFKLLKLEFDIYTVFSKSPMTLLILFGFVISIIGISFSIFLILRRFIVGPEVEGVFTLFAILFFFVGAQFLAFGVIGEYLGRIYQLLNKTPIYIVKKIEEYR